MSSTAGGGSTQTGPASDVGGRLGLSTGMVVQELGWDSDTDDELRAAVENVVDGDLVDGDYGNVVDALTDLVGGGSIWLLTPKVGRPGAVDASEIAEAAPIAGLSQTTTASVSKEWAATRLVAPKTPA